MLAWILFSFGDVDLFKAGAEPWFKHRERQVNVHRCPSPLTPLDPMFRPPFKEAAIVLKHHYEDMAEGAR